MEFGWAAAGAVIGVLFDVVKETAAKNDMFKDALESLVRKLATLKPLIEEVKTLSEQLTDEHGDDCGYYESHLEEGAEHSRKCQKVGRFNIAKKSHYTHKLLELDRTLDSLIQFAYVARAYKKILILTGKIYTVIQEQQGISIGHPYHHHIGHPYQHHIGHPYHHHQGIPSSLHNTVPPSPLLPVSQNHDMGQGWIARIGEAVGSLSDEIKESNDETSARWKAPFKKLRATLHILQLLVKEKETLDMLDYKAAYYKGTIDKGVEVVQKCSQAHGLKYLCKKPFYNHMLLQLNEVMEKLVQELLDPARQNMERKLNSVREKHDKIIRDIGGNALGLGVHYQIPTASDRLRG